MNLEDIQAEMDAPEERGAMPGGGNPWKRVVLTEIVSAKVEGWRKAVATTRERYGPVYVICEFPPCSKKFEVPHYRTSQIFACSSRCRDKAGRLRRAGKIPPRPKATNVPHKLWEYGHAAQGHNMEDS